jgi:hypothetical protein
MCRKLLILCFALAVIAMSTPVSAAPSYATPLKIDLNGTTGTSLGQTQAGWQGWDFVNSPTTNTFTKAWTIGGSKVSVELKGVKNDGSNPGSRDRLNLPDTKLGNVHEDIFFVSTTAAGVGLLGLDYIQVSLSMGAAQAGKTFGIRTFSWDSAYNTSNDSYNDDYAAWGVVNPSTNGGYHSYRWDDPCTPGDENGIIKRNIPMLAEWNMQGAPPRKDNTVGAYQYSGYFETTADSTGKVVIYGWFDGSLQGSYHMPINGLTVMPEPATVALLGLGGLALLRRRK